MTDLRLSPTARRFVDDDDETDYAAVSSALSRRREELYRLESQTQNKTMVSQHVNGNGVHNGVHNGGSDSTTYQNGNGVAPPAPSRHHHTTTHAKMDFSMLPTPKETQSYVGFANIPNQVFRRAIKLGFDFTLMVVGQSGLGKSTFINSLFLTDVYPPVPTGVVRTYPQTVHVDSKTVRLVENGVSLNLTLIDTPGFGDAVDNNKCWEPVIEYCDRKFLEYFTEETKIQRKERINDKRVHLVLYFIAPSGHGLKQLDIEFMKRLHERVNVVPVIAKADTMTPEELERFKKQISKELEAHSIKVYKFPDPEDEDERKQLQPLKERVPFAVVGSNLIKEGEGGKKIRYREYPWGVVEVENIKHNDFIALRDMIIRTNLIDLIDVTRGVHYENFRCRQLTKASLNNASLDMDPFTQMERDKHSKERQLIEKKDHMEKVFEEKVNIRERKMADRNAKFEQREKENRKTLEEKRAELERRKNALLDMKKQNPQLATLESLSSITSNGSNDRSPPEKSMKKKAGTLGGMFARNN
uniref:Septin-type G domain-containing protein n=1 Tax=Plectus sambesii TaxID=2011161 RepID=A0A914W8Y8_9BILA